MDQVNEHLERWKAQNQREHEVKIKAIDEKMAAV